jgi:hypothetical protein
MGKRLDGIEVIEWTGLPCFYRLILKLRSLQ